MSTSPLGRRTSFTLYDETRRTLTAMEHALKKRGLDVDRTDLIRALVHCTPEKEILARGILRDQAERTPEAKAMGLAVEFAPIRMNPDDYAKLERVAAQLKKMSIKASVGVLVRGLVMSDPPIEQLLAQLREYAQELPDGRALRWLRKP